MSHPLTTARWPEVIQAERARFGDRVQLEWILEESRQRGIRFANGLSTQSVSTQRQQATVQISDGHRYTREDVEAASTTSLTETTEHAIDRLGALPYHSQTMVEPGAVQLNASQPHHLLDQADAGWLAAQIAALSEQAKRAGLSLTGFIDVKSRDTGYFNYLGAEALHTDEVLSVRLTLKGEQGVASISRPFASLDAFDPHALFDTLASVAGDRREPREAPPGTYRVVLGPQATGPLAMFLGAVGFNTRSILEGRSVIDSQNPERIASELVTLVDDREALALPLKPFDFMGDTTRQLTLVDQGEPKDIPWDRALAQEQEQSSTGHGQLRPNADGPVPRSVVWQPGNNSVEGLLEQLGDGLYIHHFHYVNVHHPKSLTLTGLTRDGVYWVENGRIAWPCHNLRFTMALGDALRSVEAVGSDLMPSTALWGLMKVATPSALLGKFTFTSGTGFAG